MEPVSQSALLELSIELAQSVSSASRFDQLLTIVRKVIQCDSVVLLAYKGKYLKPLAFQGLSKECMGRQFDLAEHPRLAKICESSIPVRFPADCPLPDPYDGLLTDREGCLPVHSCMGLPLYFEGRLIGVLTLDSLTPNVFDNLAIKTLEIISSMASVSLHTALMFEVLEQRVNHSQQVLESLSVPVAFDSQSKLIGTSKAMKQLDKDIHLVAPSNYAVLIEGESGTGKELVANAIHQHSQRSSAPIVYVNCAALPESLIESELFGHVRGAFTGAESQRAGKFVIADGGTLFLDEIGELPLAVQSKLLRALQNQEIQPVGQDKVIHVDVRVLAATNRDLKFEAEQGRFRLDLYHRLNIFPIHVPPLRERVTDIPLLVGYFLEKTKRKMGIGQLTLSHAVLDAFTQYNWPGNVRELENLITRAALKASVSKQHMKGRDAVAEITLEHCGDLSHIKQPETTALADNVNSDEMWTVSMRDNLDRYQADLIRSALKLEQGNWSKAAKRLQTDRANLNRVAKRLGISVTKTINLSF